MAVKINCVGEVITAYLSGELDHHTAKNMREEIDNALEINMPTLLVLDFKDITFMDSSGIGLIMGRYRLLQRNSAQMHITNIPASIYKVMKLAGMERLAHLEQEENKK